MINFKIYRSSSMDLIVGIFIALFTVRWKIVHVDGYSLTNATDSVLGCSHNNTRFANGSLVPTVEPCLNCKCIKGNLICALRVCPEQTLPPPGCVVVQKKNSCCPYMTCSKHHTVYKDQEKKVITHDRKWYEQNIRNRIFSQNALQRRIEDSNEEQQLSNGKMCIHNGTVYRSGSAMTTSSLCSYCYCIEGKQKCIQPKCTLPAKIGCEPILINSSCCPIRYDCTKNGIIKARYNTKYNRRRNDNKHFLRMTSRMQRSRGCLVDSTFYPEGHKLPANQTNPCEICFCIGGSKRCAPKKCAPTIRNCKPIIPDGQCCPSSYDCNTFSDHKTARGFTSRQYSDIFSLFFGDEEKENSTTSWDYESETEAINSEINATNEKGLLDAITDSLNYVDGNKQNAEKQTNVPNQTVQSVLNLPSFNTSDNDENNDDDDDDDDISILDFLLKGESVFTSSTPKPFVFNITGRPLLNGMTNSPMQVQPILPDDMKNESLKFSMLPMSLYNMVKDDGSPMFDIDKIKPTVSPKPFEIDTTLSTNINHIATSTISLSASTVSATTIASTSMTSAKQKTTLKNIVETTTAASKTKMHGQSVEVNETSSSVMKNTFSTAYKIVQSTVKATPTMASTLHPSQSPVVKNGTSVKSSVTEKPFQTTTLSKNTKFSSIQSQAQNIRTTKPTTAASTTVSLQPLTTAKPQTTSALPKITTVQISSSSNPSILETDLNYDYGEVPPSLPNLKIIPFLPTDAVKNIIHKSDGYKPIYYQSNPNSNPYVESSAYSPFNIKPNAEKYPTYNGNIADDRIDYDSYKMPIEHVDNLDYINVYASNGGNMVQPASFQLNVNSKIDYSSDPKIVPPKISANKNLTVKPPLPPFEPEHEYDLYNLPPQPQLQLQPDNINEYGVDSPLSHEPYSPEHNYNVPHFVTMPPLSKPLHNNSVFSYSNKNKFIPPVKTEGGFVPKRTHIPLHGTNNVDGKFTSQNLKKQSEQQDNLNNNAHNSSNSSLENDLNNFHGVKLTEDESISTVSVSSVKASPEFVSATTPLTTTIAHTTKSAANNLTNNAIPLKLITILNNTKKENPTKVEIPQRKNNKIIDPTDEPLVEDTQIPSATTEMASLTKTESENNESLTILRDVFLSSISQTPSDISAELPHKPPLFLSRPINKFNFQSLNSLESKHNFQANPIRSELDLNYQVLPADDSNIANTESYVINPVDVDKLKQHQSNGETKIFTPPHSKDPAGLLKLAACNIYGVMYRVGRIITELSTSCLECRCTEVGVSCTPLNC